MKKYLLELIIIILQSCLFYVLPIITGPSDVMGLVILSIGACLILSFIITYYSKYHIKYLYPLIAILLYIPSMFIFTENVLLYELYYFISSLIGLIIGLIINHIKNKKC